MQARSIAKLVMTALVLAPVAVTAQETSDSFPPSTTSFADYAPVAASLTLPQSTGEKNPTVAALLNALLLPGIGNFYLRWQQRARSSSCRARGRAGASC